MEILLTILVILGIIFLLLGIAVLLKLFLFAKSLSNMRQVVDEVYMSYENVVKPGMGAVVEKVKTRTGALGVKALALAITVGILKLLGKKDSYKA